MKKKITIFLCLSLIVTMFSSIGILAVEKEITLDEALKILNEKIKIPEEYTEFESDMFNGDFGISYWYLRWTTEDESKVIAAEVDSNSHITYYDIYDSSNYTYNFSMKKMPKLLKEDCKKIADNFFELLDPDYYTQSKSKRSNFSDYDQSDDTYLFEYIRYVNGIPSSAETVNIWVNYMTGKIINYNASYVYDIKYSDPKEAIAEEKAKEKFAGLADMELSYAAYYDENVDKWIAKLVWGISNNNIRIDAFTGEKLEASQKESLVPNASSQSNPQMDSVMSGMDAYTIVNLSPAQQEALEESKGLISLSDADAKIRSLSYTGINKSYDISFGYLLSNNYNKSNYVWFIAYVIQSSEEDEIQKTNTVSYYIIDAVTSEFNTFFTLSENSVYYEENLKPVYTVDEIKIKVNEFVKKAAGKKASSFKETEFFGVPLEGMENISEDFIFINNFIRYENGYKFDQNKLSVVFDNFTGTVIGYGIEWFDNIDFNTKSAVISKEEAYKTLFENISLKLAYESIESGSAQSGYDLSLAYSLDYSSNSKSYFSGYFDALTGEMVDSGGKPISISPVHVPYKDIENHYAYKFINQLYEIDITLEGDMFFPDRAITQEEFLGLMAKAYSYEFYSRDKQKELYDTFIELGVLKEDEKNPTAQITRTDAVKYIVRIRGHEEVADITGIYNVYYKDDPQIPEGMKGYFIICHGLKIIGGTPEGNILPNKVLTRAEAAVIIYNLLKLQI